MLGYLSVFLAIVSSAYLRSLVRFFGRPFVQVHHVVSVTGLILITLHPLGVAWSSGTLRVFLPRFDSWAVFLQLGGRTAWYLIGIASLAALLRNALGRNWRMVHFLNYLAFLLATAHGVMIGTDFQSPVVRVVSVVMAVVVIGIFVQKRLASRRR
jgi:predicted ferric reductase